MRRFAVLLVLCLAATFALADEPPPSPSGLLPPPSQSLSDAQSQRAPTIYIFMATHADCASASDGCMICKRNDGDFVCSTPGIACMTRAAVCDVTLPKAP
jgi:hypothetical protein